jgi:DNA-binding MarR family transcriptional regulator
MEMIEHDLDQIVDTVECLLPRIMRRVFLAPDGDSPLWDLPLPQLRLLGMLERHGGARMSEVSEKLGVALSTATQIADRLTARGWVQRESDPEDRRVVRLALTQAGRQLAKERRSERRRRLRAMLSAIDPEARERAVAALEVLYQGARTLDAEDRETVPPPPAADGALWELVAARSTARAEL